MNQKQFGHQGARRTLALIAAGLLGALFAIVICLAFLAATRRDNLPEVTAKDLAEAVRRWRQASVENYVLEVQVAAQQNEVHRVEVRDGVVESYELNGRLMAGRRTLDTWSVPGMLDTIQSDIDHLTAVAEGREDRYTPKLSLWGLFHPSYGYPERYRRVQWGTNVEVSWEVILFQVSDNAE